MSAHENEYGEFDLKEWCIASKITEPGQKKIEANSVDDLETLLLFQDQDIDLLKLSAGDTLRFRVAVRKLQVIADTPPELKESDSPVKQQPGGKHLTSEGKKSPLLENKSSSERLYTTEEVQRLLAGKEAVTLGASGVTGVSTSALVSTGVCAKDTLSALLGNSTSTIEEVRNLMRDFLNLDDTPLNSKGDSYY